MGDETPAAALVPPYPVRRNPGAAAAREHGLRWARATGLLGGAEAGFALWDEEDFAGFDLPGFAALVHPDARGDLLELVTDWYVWSWYLDDLLLERFKRPRDAAGARRFLARLAEFAGDRPPAGPADPAERGLADLWRRTTAARPAGWRSRLKGCVPNLLDDALWEIDNLCRGQVPDPADYLQMRRAAGGAPWAAQLVEYVLGVELPEELVGSTPVQRLHDAFADVVDLHNDLVSYRRETEYEQEISNAVVVWRHFLGGGAGEAAQSVRRLLEARLRLFDRLATVDVPAHLAATGAGPAVLRGTARYLAGLRDWLAGDYQWHRETDRYRPASWQRTRPAATGWAAGPRGLGTSAARLRR
ncbi:hypothetical protein [Streptomyces sp. NPDC089919]|uniref:terpene synthase family protein n=1 Tax=Streptomyces sp. NPDC089919 TaxID=3155188 RepID=UPI0034479CAA